MTSNDHTADELLPPKVSLVNALKSELISKIDHLLTLEGVPEEFKAVFQGNEYKKIKTENEL
jgi:hypothetical protein